MLLTASPNAAAGEASTPLGGEWNFRATLDGEPIGEHRFVVTGEGGERKVVSDASFAVRFLGVTVYRYRHRAVEQWRGGCLVELQSSTDDNGKASDVRAEQRGGELVVRTPAPEDPIKGCAMSFAYWNPAIQTQQRLLNAQSGKLEAVQVERVGSGSIEVRGQPVAATAYRITGPARPIEVWYSERGEWIGLDSNVKGGRKISYRLP